MFDRFRRRARQALALGFVLLASPALAATLLGTIGSGREISELVEIDPATGLRTRVIGSIGYTVNGLAWDRVGKVLYASTAHASPTFRDGLITIDINTGAGTPVGTGAGRYLNLLTTNSAGELYGWSEGPLVSGRLVHLNKTTGVATEVGNSGINTARHSVAFGNNDVLYLVSPNGFADVDPNVYTIDPLTAAATLVGPVAGLPHFFAHHGTIDPVSNLMYAFNATEEYGESVGIVTIDLATHSVLSTLDTGDKLLHTLAFADLPQPPVVGAAVSRKQHGAAGTFDLTLSPNPLDPTTEPRSSAGAHTIVFIFDKPVVGGTASVTAGTATAALPTFSGNEMRVALTEVPTAQYVTVAVADVVAADGGSGGSGSVRVGILAGDVAASRSVTLSDLLDVNANLTQPVNAARFLRDVNVDGFITISDKLVVNANLTQNLPLP